MACSSIARAVRPCAAALALLLVCTIDTAAATLTVPEGGDLQGAINAAQPGDVIVLAPGATYIGNFRLPAKPGATFITIRTGGPGVPAPGMRVSPEHAPALAKIRSSNTTAALTTDAGAHHWRLEAIEFQANANGSGDIIVLGRSGAQTQTSDMPWGIVLDRLYIHGDPVLGQKRGVALNSGYTEVLNSYISDIKAVGVDSQALCGWNGTGPFLIENNYLEAAGENVMFGGADPSIPGLVPSDITLRRNTLAKPLAWRGEKWTVKNIFELKNARRVLVEGNVFENVWKAAQAGFAIVFTPRNQDGKAPWSVVEDVTFRYNVVRHAGSAINLTGFDDIHPSQQTRRVQIAHNVIYDIDAGVWGGSGIFLQVGNGAAEIVVEKNTVLQSGTAVNVYGKRSGAPWVIDGFVFRDNLMRHNAYGVKGDGIPTGMATLTGYFSNLLFERNVLAGGSASKYPAGNYFPSVAEFEASFVDIGAGDLSLTLGNPFVGSASDGGALGADTARVTSAIRGIVSATPPAAATPGASVAGASGTASGGESTGRAAVCRPGSTCVTVDPYATRRR